MPPTGSTFTDWQQIEAAERRLLMDEDFSWSEPPTRSRRRVEEPLPARRRTAVAERERDEEREQEEEREQDDSAYARDPQAQAAKTHSEFDALMQRWNEAYGDEARARSSAPQHAADARDSADAYDAFDSFDISDSHDISAANADSYDPNAFDYDDLARYTQAPVLEDRSGDYVYDAGRRTVVITGRGAERHAPVPRRRPSSNVRFHERAGFSPDRTAMWAVLLGVALLIGCVVH